MATNGALPGEEGQPLNIVVSPCPGELNNVFFPGFCVHDMLSMATTGKQADTPGSEDQMAELVQTCIKHCYPIICLLHV